MFPGVNIFGPSGGFQTRQAIRDAYQDLAVKVRGIVPALSVSLRAVVVPYLVKVSNVIGRGATLADLDELKMKIAEWQTLYEKEQTTADVFTPYRLQPIQIAVSPDAPLLKPTGPIVRTGTRPDAPAVVDYVTAGFEQNPVMIVVAIAGLIWLLKR